MYMYIYRFEYVCIYKQLNLWFELNSNACTHLQICFHNKNTSQTQRNLSQCGTKAKFHVFYRQNKRSMISLPRHSLITRICIFRKYYVYFMIHPYNPLIGQLNHCTHGFYKYRHLNHHPLDCDNNGKKEQRKNSSNNPKILCT